MSSYLLFSNSSVVSPSCWSGISSPSMIPDSLFSQTFSQGHNESWIATTLSLCCVWMCNVYVWRPDYSNLFVVVLNIILSWTSMWRMPMLSWYMSVSKSTNVLTCWHKMAHESVYGSVMSLLPPCARHLNTTAKVKDTNLWKIGKMLSICILTLVAWHFCLLAVTKI